MSFPKIPFLFGVLGATALSAVAQTAPLPAPSPGSLTSVDSFGNMVRVNSNGAGINPGGVGSNSVSSDRTRRGDRNDFGRGGNRGGVRYNVPVNPYYPYGYPAQSYNNYYFPPQIPTTIVGSTNYSWQKPITITSIGGFYSGFPAPVYPAPGYGYGYPAPGYGYPVQGYGHPNQGYGFPNPGYGYPGGFPYGPSTYIYGNAPGTIYSQSQTGGYGFSVGNGGVSIQLGNRQSSTSTTVTRY